MDGLLLQLWYSLLKLIIKKNSNNKCNLVNIRLIILRILRIFNWFNILKTQYYNIDIYLIHWFKTIFEIFICLYSINLLNMIVLYLIYIILLYSIVRERINKNYRLWRSSIKYRRSIYHTYTLDRGDTNWIYPIFILFMQDRMSFGSTYTWLD